MPQVPSSLVGRGVSGLVRALVRVRAPLLCMLTRSQGGMRAGLRACLVANRYPLAF